MYKINKTKARKILIDEEHFLPLNADRMLKDFPPIQEPLAQAVQKWLEDRTIVDISVEGLTIKKVIHDQGYHFLIAVKNLNKLLDQTIPEDERKNLLKALKIPSVFL
jgi:hypothetical protein